MRRILLALTLILVTPVSARAAVGDALRCGRLRDDFQRSNNTDLGPNWNEVVPDLKVSGGTLTSASASGAPLATWTGTLPDTRQACVNVFGGDGTPGAYAAVALKYTSQSNLLVARLVDAVAPYDGNFDSLVLAASNTGTGQRFALPQLVSYATLRVSVPSAGATGHITAAVDYTLDGKVDFQQTVDTAASAGTTIGLGSYGGTTLDDFSTPSAQPVAQLGGGASYTEQAPPAPVFSQVTVSDADDTSLKGAQVSQVAGSGQLGFTNTANITKTANSNSHYLELTGTATLADYQSALRSVTYSDASDAPSTAEVLLSLDDGDPIGPYVSQVVSITQVNDQPAVTATSAALTYTEDEGARTVDPGLVVSDPDLSTLTGATVRVVGPAATESLGFVNQLGITGSYSAGTLTLSGTAPFADYQKALRTVTYASTEQNPAGSRSIEFRVADSGLESAPATRSIALTPTDDAPVLTTTAAPLGYRQGDPAVTVDPGVTVTDVDDTVLEGATVAVGAPAAGDVLAFTPSGGISGTFANGTLTLTGSASLGAYQAVLRTVTFATSRADTPRTVTFAAGDGDLLSAGAARTIAIAAAPTATPTASSTPTATASATPTASTTTSPTTEPTASATPTTEPTATPSPSPLTLTKVSVRSRRLKRGKAQVVRFTLSGPGKVKLVFAHKRKRIRASRTVAAAGAYSVRVAKRFATGRWRVTVSAGAAKAVRRFRVVSGS